MQVLKAFLILLLDLPPIKFFEFLIDFSFGHFALSFLSFIYSRSLHSSPMLFWVRLIHVSDQGIIIHFGIIGLGQIPLLDSLLILFLLYVVSIGGNLLFEFLSVLQEFFGLLSFFDFSLMT